MGWFLWLGKILLLYWSSIFFHELGHWIFLKIFKIPFKIKIQWMPPAIYSYYRTSKQKYYIIASAGILNGFGFIFAFYLWDRNYITLLILLLLYLPGCLFDLYKAYTLLY